MKQQSLSNATLLPALDNYTLSEICTLLDTSVATLNGAIIEMLRMPHNNAPTLGIMRQLRTNIESIYNELDFQLAIMQHLGNVIDDPLIEVKFNEAVELGQTLQKVSGLKWQGLANWSR